MKIILPVLLFAFAGTASAQSAKIRTPAAPGCGSIDTKFDVQTKRSQHPLATPDAGKALVYFLQDDSYFFTRPRPTTRFGLNGSWIGATQANAYFYVPVDPGEHHICADWQFIGQFVTGPRTAALHFTAEPGGIYFFVVEDHFTQDREPAAMKLLPLDADEAQLRMSRFGLS